MVQSHKKTDQVGDETPYKFSWKRTLGALFGSNIRETIEDIRVIRGSSKKRNDQQYQSKEPPAIR